MSSREGLDLDATFGVLFVGFMVSSAFYGCIFFQTYVFYTRYPGENIYTKSIIGSLCVIDTVITGLLFHAMYEYLVDNFMISFNHLIVLRTFVTAFALTNAEILFVQLFYAYRTWSLANRRLLYPVIMSSLSVASFALSLATAVQMSKQFLFRDIVTSKVKLLAGSSEGLAVLCDILVVATQYFYLNPSRHPGMKVQQSWSDIGILHILSRGNSFMILQLVLLLTFVTIPHQVVWVCFQFVIGKIYTNSLLAMLNSRQSYQGRGLNEEESQNTRSRSTGVSGSDASPGEAGIDVGDALQGKVTATSHSSPVSPLNFDSKEPRNVAMELEIIRSRSDLGFGDEAPKLIMDDDLFRSTPELNHKRRPMGDF